MTAADPGRVVVVIPTYNEIDNLAVILARLRAAVPCAHALVVDDSSPDGTGRLADRIAAEDERVHVLHRPAKQGLGSAYLTGFRWALDEGFDVVVEMDADGSHAPEDLPTLLAALADGADLVIGSRYTPGGKVHDWPAARHLLSRGANAYTRLMLGVPLRDVTAGFRAYRGTVLRALPLDRVASQGYCFQVDLAWRAWRAGFGVTEAPITFTDRARGQSKMSRSVVTEAFWRVTVWGFSTRSRADRKRALAARR